MTFDEMDAIAPSIALFYSKQESLGCTIFRDSTQGEFIYDVGYTLKVKNINNEIKTFDNFIKVKFTKWDKKSLNNFTSILNY